MTIPIVSSSWESCSEPSAVAGESIPTLSCAQVVLNNLISAFIIFSGVVALILIIWGGIKYMNSRGDPQAVEGAKKTITWAIIGLVFIAFSFAILQLIKTVTGAQF